jgi:hypothetical protein
LRTKYVNNFSLAFIAPLQAQKHVYLRHYFNLKMEIL